jgi:hypothetical protein
MRVAAMIDDLFRGPVPDGGVLVATAGLPPDARVGPDPATDAGPDAGPRGGFQHLDLDTVDPATEPADRRAGAVAIVARTVTDLRRAATLGGVLPPATRITLAVLDTAGAPLPSLPLSAPGGPPVSTCQARMSPDGGWSATVTLASPRPAGELLAAATADLARHWHTPVTQVALAGPGAAHWRPGDPGVRLSTLAGTASGPDAPPVADLVLRTVAPDTPLWADPRVPAIDRLQPEQQTWICLARPGGLRQARAVAAAVSQVDHVPPYDERTVNPTGFLAQPDCGHGRLTQQGACWAVVSQGADPVPIHPGGGVTAADVHRLRRLRAVAVDWGRHTGPLAAVRTVAGLAGAGVPLVAAAVPPWAMALGTKLVALLTSVRPAGLADDLMREQYSVRLRRAAFADHSTLARWRHLAASVGLPLPPPPLISVLLCTRRPDHLGSALAQIGRQRGVNLEVVVTLHGHPADQPAVRRAVAAFAGTLTIVEVDAAVPFGEALNRGAAAASGRYLAKWDDDDWYGPDFLADLVMAAHYSGADLVGCFANLVYLEEIGITVHRPGPGPEQPGRQVAGGTLVIDRGAFTELGGFRPVRRRVDTLLQQAVAAAGGTTYRTHGLGYVHRRRRSDHTWTPPVTYFLRGSGRQWRGFAPGPLIHAEQGELTLNDLRSR